MVRLSRDGWINAVTGKVMFDTDIWEIAVVVFMLLVVAGMAIGVPIACYLHPLPRVMVLGILLFLAIGYLGELVCKAIYAWAEGPHNVDYAVPSRHHESERANGTFRVQSVVPVDLESGLGGAAGWYAI